MPVTFTPVENDRIMYFKLTDPWTSQELTKYFPDEQKYFFNSPGAVHSLFDITDMRTMDPHAVQMRHSPNLEHPKGGYIVVVGANLLSRTLIDLVERLSQSKTKRFKHLPTYEEAIAFLKKEIEAEDMKIAQKVDKVAV